MRVSMAGLFPVFASLMRGITVAIVMVAMLFGSAQEVRAMSFPDIRSPILDEAVSSLVKKGAISGYPDGSFKAEKTINRAEALKIIFALKQINLSSGGEAGRFRDVDKKAWYFPYISEALRRKIVTGYPDGSFKPEKTVNKAEFLKMAFIAQDWYQDRSDPYDAMEQYADLNNDEWFTPFVAFGFNKGLLDKTTKLFPNKGISWGEAVIILARVSKEDDLYLTPRIPFD